MTADQWEKRKSIDPQGSKAVGHSTLSPRRSSLQERSEKDRSERRSDSEGPESRWTSSVAPPSVESFREEFAPDLEPAEDDPAWRGWEKRDRSEVPAPPGWAAVAPGPGSPGYYSLSAESLDEVEIPPAPRVPDLTLDELPPESEGDFTPMDVFDMERVAHSKPEPAPLTLRPPPPERSSWLPTNEGEFPETEPPPFRRYSSDYPARARSVSFSPESARRVALREFGERPSVPPRIYFSPHVRQQASEWAETGSLSLPGCSSPRHARAVQRALLLALLTEPGWNGLPQGLRQRAGWLFCMDWDTSSAAGHPYREADDLATVLSMPANDESRQLLRAAVAAVLPASAARGSRPPPRRSSRPPRSKQP